MPQIIPPSPVDSPFGSYNWADWYEKVRRAINNSLAIAWSQITDFTGSNLTNLATRNHNDLQSIQGGSGGNYWHLPSGAASGVVATWNGSTWIASATPQYFQLALSDLTTALTTGTNNGYFDMPFAGTLTEVIFTVITASSSGLPQLGVKKNGTTMLSTNATIDVSETSSLTAATPPVISVTSAAKGDRISFDIVAAGTGTKGAQATLVFTRP